MWTGLVLGISFVEAPTKFTAPSLDLLVALDVGRVVFAMSHRVQLGLLLLTAACGVAAWRPLTRYARTLLVATSVVVAVQVFVVQPPLDARTARLIAGEALDPSRLHLCYVALDLSKVGFLTALGWSLRELSPSGRSSRLGR